MAKQVKTIGVLTSGGDAPGMNAAIRAVVRTAISKGMKVKGIMRGYAGLLQEEIVDMSSTDVSNIIFRGGTILYTARCMEFYEASYREKAFHNAKEIGLDGLVVIGGDGSYRGAGYLSELGLPCIGVPGTIDNDIKGTDFTLGFDTCLNTILDAISKIRDTATSHERTILVEVMGRHAGDLALQACLAGGGDGVLIPEMDNPIELLALQIKERRKHGKLHDIVLVAEGVGKVQDIEKALKERITTEVRSVVLGHVQRGGTPSGFDRMLATRMGAKAIEILENDEGGVMVGLENNRLVTHPISYAWDGERNYSIKDDYELALILSK